MRWTEAENGMEIAVVDDTVNCWPWRGGSLAKCVVLDREYRRNGSRRGWFLVRLVWHRKPWAFPAALQGRNTLSSDEFVVNARACWPWTEETTDTVESHERESSERWRKTAELKEIVEHLGVGSVSNCGICFSYEEITKILHVFVVSKPHREASQ